MSQDKTLELVVQELQNRIGQITSQYETQMAVLKAQAQQAIEAKDAEIASLQTPANEEKSK
jgi:acetolactate synthase small subunit